MNIALVGFEVEGRAAFAYWSNLGAHITVCDQDFQKNVPDGADKQLGENYLKNLTVSMLFGVRPALIRRLFWMKIRTLPIKLRRP